MQEKELLERSLNEIRLLKQQNKEMGLRLNMFDSVMRIFNTPKGYDSCSGGMIHPDVEFELIRRLQELKQNSNVDNSVKAGPGSK